MPNRFIVYETRKGVIKRIAACKSKEQAYNVITRRPLTGLRSYDIKEENK